MQLKAFKTANTVESNRVDEETHRQPCRRKLVDRARPEDPTKMDFPIVISW